jgi:hypothetical protein
MLWGESGLGWFLGLHFIVRLGFRNYGILFYYNLPFIVRCILMTISNFGVIILLFIDMVEGRRWNLYCSIIFGSISQNIFNKKNT